MTGIDGEPCRIRDVDRNSKILRDIPLLDRKFDSFTPEVNRGSVRQRHYSNYDTHQVCRDFPRASVAWVNEEIQQLQCHFGEDNKRSDFNSKIDEGESWFQVSNGIDDPFHGLYHKYGESDSLISRFKRNLPDFDGFWHVEDLLTWLDAVEDFFDEVKPPEHVKCKIVSNKMKGLAYYWWHRLQDDRNKRGKEEITSWKKMKNLLLKRFSPTECSTKCPNQQNQWVEEGMEVVKDLKADKFTPTNCSIKIPSEPYNIKQDEISGLEIFGASEALFTDGGIETLRKPTPITTLLEEFELEYPLSEQYHIGDFIMQLPSKSEESADGLYRTKEISKIEANTAVISRVQQSEKVKKKVTPTICSKKARFESHGIKQSQIQIDNFEVHPSSIGGLQLKSSEDWSGPTVECSTTKHGESAEKFDEEKPLQQKVEVMPTTKGNSSNNNNVGEESKDGCSGENDQELVKLKLEYKVTHINDTSKRALELMNMPGITRELHMRSFKDWSTSTTKNSTITHSRMIEQREHEELKDMKVIIPQSAPLVEAHTFVAFVVGKSAIVMEARPYLSKVELRAGIPLSVVSETLTILLLGDYMVFNLLIDGITMFLFDPGGCLCSLETWDVIFVVVSADSFVLNVTIGGIKFYTQWAVGEVIANPNMFVGFMANALGIDLPYDSVYGMLMLRVRQDNTKLAHDNKRYTWYSIQKSIRGCVAYFDAYSDQLDVFKCHPLNRSKNVTSLIYGEYMASVHSNTRRALFLFDPGGVVCSLRACCDDLWTGLKAKLMSFRSVHAVIKNCEPTDIMMIVRAIFESCVPISSSMEMIYSCHVPYKDAATWHIDHMLKALYEVSEWFLGENGDLFGYIIAVGITKQLAISSARPLVTDNDVRDLGFWRLRETCMGSFMNFDGLFHESEFRNDGRQTLNFDLGGNQGWEYRVAQMGVKFTVSVKSVAEKIWSCGNRSRAIGFIGGTLSITVYSHHIECFLEVADSSSYFVTMKITTVPWPILTRCESSLKILSSEPRKYVLLSVIVQMRGLPAGSKTKIEDNLDEFSLIGKAEPFPLVDYKEWKNYGENVQEIAIAWEEDYYLVMDIKIADLCWTWVKKTLRLFFKLVNGLDPPMKSGDEHEELKEEYYGFARGRAFFLFRGMEMM